MPPELTFEQLTYRVYRGSVLSAQGEAVHASFRRDTSDVAADDVTVRFPPQGDRVEARVSAPRGTGNLRERRFLASGGVRAEQGQDTAFTPSARYLATDGLVRGDEPVELRSGRRLTVQGPGFTLSPDEQVLRIAGGARIVAGEERP